MPQRSNRTVRVQARVAPATLQIVKLAAAMQGRTVSAFVADAAETAANRAETFANRTVEEAAILRLSAEWQIAFAEALRREASRRVPVFANTPS